MKKLYIYSILLLFLCSISLTAQTASENYIKKTSFRTQTTSGSVSIGQKIESVMYYDGLGRPSQSIEVRAGGNPHRSLINMTSWETGSGSIGIYNINGSISENYRELGTDPFGRAELLWKCGND